MPDRIDMDLSDITSPFSTLKEGTYTLTIDSAENTVSKEKNLPMVKVVLTAENEEGETVYIRDYIVLAYRSGKFRLRQLIQNAGGDVSNPDISILTGSSVDAEVEETDDEQFGPGNNIRRYLVEIIK